MRYQVREYTTRDTEILPKVHRFVDFRSAIEFYMEAEKPYHYGKNGGIIELVEEKTLMNCS